MLSIREIVGYIIFIIGILGIIIDRIKLYGLTKYNKGRRDMFNEVLCNKEILQNYDIGEA